MQQAERYPFGYTIIRVAAIANLVAAVWFAVLLFVTPIFAEVSARANYAELDRAGAINASNLAGFHPSRNFGNGLTSQHRTTVPLYIASSALVAQRVNALLGLVFVTGNAVCWTLAWWKLGRRAASPSPAESNDLLR